MERQVQVKLEDIYVSLRAERDYEPGSVDRPIVNVELAELDQIARTVLPVNGHHDDSEQLLIPLEGRDPQTFTLKPDEILQLSEVIDRHEHLVILGDPGSGKSTLLRYLTLKHARAMYEGQHQIVVRIASATGINDPSTV